MKKFIWICMALVLTLFVSNCAVTVYADELIAPNSRSAILVDAKTGNVLLNKNAQDKVPIASIVKLMTLYVIFDNIEQGKISIDDEVIASEYACSMGGSQLFLDANSKHKVDDLLKSVIVASANDSCVVLAEAIAGNEQTFVELMNTKTGVIGLKNTLYTDCTGLREDQYSTAEDVVILSQKVLSHPLYQQYAKIWLEEYTHPTGRITEIANTNKLIRTLDGCLGGKTGTTDNAGYCLTILAERNSMSLICVVLGADSTQHRFDDNKNLINYGFTNYKEHIIVSKEEPIGILKSNKLKPSGVELFAESNYGIVALKNEEINATYQIQIFEDAKTVKGGEPLGKVYIIRDNNVIGEVNLVAKQDVNLKTYKDYVIDIINLW